MSEMFQPFVVIGGESRPAPETVYIIRCTVTGRVKIGIADDPNVRLNVLQAMCPTELELVTSFPGGLKRERELHKQFADCRLHGEWFDPDDDLKMFIKAAEEARDAVG